MDEHNFKALLVGTLIFKFEEVLTKIEVISPSYVTVVFSDIDEPMHCMSIAQAVHALDKYLNIDAEERDKVYHILKTIVKSINHFKEAL